MPDPELIARKASIGYARQLVVEGLDLEITQGSFTALLGRNGSGKSTVLRSLAGLHPLQSGAVLLDGKAIASLPTKSVARRIGFRAQSSTRPEGMTVLDLVRQGRYPHRTLFGGWSMADTAAVEEALDLTSTDHMRDAKLDTLSGGQRQRAWIAMTLAQQGGILLDEPATYLDLAHPIELLDLARDLIETRGTTVVAVLHDLNQAARYSDHLLLLKKRRVHSRGTPTEVLTAPAISEVFGVEVAILTDPDTGSRSFRITPTRSAKWRTSRRAVGLKAALSCAASIPRG
ncbi:ABC transporter ATP-binding protein [Paracoccus ravus]|uniref:ABC transporter ATP-binding protein n=1 Tax=Paracoccus ravus TaxID=2447760 RepID=UPI00106EB7D8|nr:ABC transporter ATP-binding protein [Paracoccus ravus]